MKVRKMNTDRIKLSIIYKLFRIYENCFVVSQINFCKIHSGKKYPTGYASENIKIKRISL